MLVALQMWRGDALVCPDGAVFAKSCNEAVLYEAVLIGLQNNAVVAFNSETCPQGWQDYVAASGRFIVGTGAPFAVRPVFK